MAQRLIVMRDRIAIRGDAERARDLRSRRGLRQLPEPPEQPVGHAPREHDRVAGLHPQRSAREDRQLALPLAWRGDGVARLSAALVRRAARRDRAHEALRLGRRAQRRAELHQALVEIAGCHAGGQGIDERAGASPQLALTGAGFHVVIDRVDAGEHARDVAVDQRRALAERDRRDRTCRIRADAGHFA